MTVHFSRFSSLKHIWITSPLSSFCLAPRECCRALKEQFSLDLDKKTNTDNINSCFAFFNFQILRFLLESLDNTEYSKSTPFHGSKIFCLRNQAFNLRCNTKIYRNSESTLFAIFARNCNLRIVQSFWTDRTTKQNVENV